MAVFIGFCLLSLCRQTDRRTERGDLRASFLPSGNLSCIKYQGKTDGGREQCSAERVVVFGTEYSALTQPILHIFLPGEDLGDASVADPELPGDVAGAHAVVRQLDDPLADDVGQRPPVDEDAAQLVHTAVT